MGQGGETYYRVAALLLNELAFRMRLAVTSTMKEKKKKTNQCTAQTFIRFIILLHADSCLYCNALFVKAVTTERQRRSDDDDEFLDPITIQHCVCQCAVRSFHSIVSLSVHGLDLI